MYKILSINPGSTSTKFAVYEGEKLVCLHTVRHSVAELSNFKSIYDQCGYRKSIIVARLQDDGIDLSKLSAIVGRGGLVKPLESGVYKVNEKLIHDLTFCSVGEHASNLGGLIANEIASEIPNCQAYIADPVVVDELQDVARISGLPHIPRRSMFHALNHKAVARKYAASLGVDYQELNLVVAHLGGGISVAAHCKGRVIDVNQGLDGYGPFSPERAGTLDAGVLVKMCFDSKYSLDEIKSLLTGKGGLMAHLGTNEVRQILQDIENGNKKSILIMEAMSYSIAKEIGAMFVVLNGKADAIILTGGLAHCQFVVDYIKQMISTLTKIIVYPGEDEMEALAMSGLRVLKGEKANEY